MKLDVSREFANMRGYVKNIVMSAARIGDDEVLVDLTRELALMLVNMYDVKTSDSESFRTLLRQKFDEVIAEVGLKRTGGKV